MSKVSVIDMAPEPLGVEQLVARARRVFDEGRTRPFAFRKRQLLAVKRCLEVNEAAFCRALHADLRKPYHEAMLTEVSFLINDLLTILHRLEGWMRPERVEQAMPFMLDELRVQSEPYGVALVIGAWNYPLVLTMDPVIGAIAAGNCVIIKPSDLSLATSQLLYDLLPNYLDPECYPVFLGGVPETQALLAQRFDYIFFTGAPTIGKIVHRAAAEFLTPTTLELGGKSPCFIDAGVDMPKTVKRIFWGKFTNAGQTCIAPDYVLCTKSVQEGFVACAGKILREFYGDDAQKSGDFCRIINQRHFERLLKLLGSCKVAVGGRYDQEDLYIEPTVAVDVEVGDPLMQEEIFGPILPIVSVESEEEAIEYINRNEKPLALYVFTRRRAIREKFLARTSSGGVTINDTLMHICPDSLPFGGVGNSGMGNYHGKASFDTFSHKRSVYRRDFSEVGEKAQMIRYPPFSKTKTELMKMALRTRKGIGCEWFKYLFAFVLGGLVVVLIALFV